MKITAHLERGFQESSAYGRCLSSRVDRSNFTWRDLFMWIYKNVCHPRVIDKIRLLMVIFPPYFFFFFRTSRREALEGEWVGKIAMKIFM